MSQTKLCYLLDRYFDMFEAEYYHPAMVDKARRQFKQYVIKSGELDKIVLGYIERQSEILNAHLSRHCNQMRNGKN